MRTTETLDPSYVGFDSWDDETILAALSEGQMRAIEAVRIAQPILARAARTIAARLGDDGRIMYAGAGSSGLLAAQDGMELGGTFDWPDGRVAFVLANGNRIGPMAGAPEDDAGRGRADMLALIPTARDCVIAVAASGSTAYTLSAARAAQDAGALTVGIANNSDAPLLRRVEIPVLLDSGPEVIVGSTPMAAGTAPKAALGLMSSLVMIRLGRVYDGLMVVLRADNAKLKRRAVAALVHVAGCPEAEAQVALDRCGGRIKSAALVVRGLGPDEAGRMLDTAEGNLRVAMAALN